MLKCLSKKIRKLSVLAGLLVVVAFLLVGCGGHPAGWTSPRELTDAEKEKVIAAALNTPEIKAQLAKEATYKTNLSWIAIVWNGSQASEWRILNYDWEKDPNFTLVTKSSVFYAHVLFNFGEPPKWQVYIAVNPDTGKAFMVMENPFRTGPTPPAPTPTPVPTPQPTPSPTPAPQGVPPGTPGAAADDIVTAPGGFTYRANVHQEGQPDWPPIPQSQTSVSGPFGAISLQYRSYIESKADETRNNIFFLDARNAPEIADPLQVSYRPEGLPDGMTLARDRQMYGGIGGQDKKSSRVVLKIQIAANVKPGEYPFAIHLVYQEKDFGSIPCTVKVLG